MANPTITNVNRNSINAYYTAANSGDANATTGVSQRVRIYAIDAVDGPTGRFTYAELFDAINTYNGTSQGGGNFTGRISIDVETDLTDFDAPSRTFGWTTHPGSEASVFCLRSGTLYHEIPGTTLIQPGQNEFIINPMSCPALFPSGESSATTIEAAQPTYDTQFRGNHEITLGRVYWETNGDRAFQIGGNAIQAADLGDPTKGTGRSPARLLYSQVAPGPNQTITVTDDRLRFIVPSDNSDRADIDFYGTGVIDMSCTIESRRNGNDFFHNGNANPSSNIRVRTIRNETIGTTTVRREFAGVEPFTTNPSNARHVYLDADNCRTTAALDFTTDTVNQTGGQFQAAFVGAGRFNNATTRQRLVLQGIKATSHRYWTNQFSSSDVTDVIHLDPSTPFTSSNTPFNMAQSNAGDRRKDTVMLRSIGVDSQDASGVGKDSLGFVMGHQGSSTARTHRSTWLSGIIPPIRAITSSPSTTGTWSVRFTDTDGAGNAGVVGRGVHYLHDATWEDNTQGSAAADYTRYDDNENKTYLLHRGGLNRVNRSQSLRSTPWNFDSLGSTGVVVSNQVDDIPGLTDNHIDIFRQGLTGQATTTATLAAGSIGTYTIDGFSNLTDAEVASMVEAQFTGNTGQGRVLSATRTNATTVSLQIQATNSLGLSNNANVTVWRSVDYTWDIPSSGTFTISPVNEVTTAGEITGISSATNSVITFSSAAVVAEGRIRVGDVITVAGTTGATGFNTTYGVTAVSGATVTTNRDTTGFSGTPVFTATTSTISTNLRLNYTALACLVQAKLETLARTKRSTMNSTSTNFTTSTDKSWAGGTVNINELVDRMINVTSNVGTITGISAASAAVITMSSADITNSGLMIGDTITVTGSTVSAYNTTYKITAVGSTTLTTSTNTSSSGSYTGSSTANFLIADPSYHNVNTTTSTTLDVNRVTYSGLTNSAMVTLDPDSTILSLNYGSSYTIPSGVVHNGAHTDSNGSPNFIDITFPVDPNGNGTALIPPNDVTLCVSYQYDRPLANYAVSTALNTGDVSFNSTSTPSSTTWQAVNRPTATGLDNPVSSTSSWDWSTSTNPIQRLVVQGSLTEGNIDTLEPWIDAATNSQLVLGANSTLTSYGIYRASEGAEQGSGIALNLELITSVGAPGTGNIVWYFAVDSSGSNQTITRAGGNWATGNLPTITTGDNRNFVNISPTVSNDAFLNSDNTWVFTIVGGKIEPVRNTYVGSVPADTTINLVADSLRPASAVAAVSTTVATGAYSITSPGSNSEVKTFLTEDLSFPNEQISTVDRLALIFNGYNSSSESDRTKIDVGDALNSTIVAQYVGANGTAAISDMIRVSDTNLLDSHWRIRYDGVSQINYLNMDGLTPVTSGTNNFETDAVDAAAVAFFSSPEYSAGEVTGLVDATVQRIIDAQTTDLGGRLTNVSLGIPT